jgi:hypothetical protein
LYHSDSEFLKADSLACKRLPNKPATSLQADLSRL